MAELIAQGNGAGMQWRRVLPDHETIVLGRDAPPWSVAWDRHISRRHVELRWDQASLHVRRLPQAKNPVFFQGDPKDSFTLTPGEQFVVGATLFSLVETTSAKTSAPASSPFSEQTFSSAFLRDWEYRDAARRVDVLGRLPEVISGAGNDEQLFQQIVRLMLSGISEATTVAIVETEEVAGETNSPHDSFQDNVRVLHWGPPNTHRSTPFVPSRRLVKRALQTSQSVLHVWDIDDPQSQAAFTLAEDVLWSFATPVPEAAAPGKQWCIYVAGGRGIRGSTNRVDTEALQDELKFTELAASTISSLMRLRKLERQQTSLRQFFSPIVLEAIGHTDPEHVFKPRETDVSVLFCDLQGFSRTSEKHSQDLLGLLDRVSRVLGLTTRAILNHGGVVGDFHGDASMGFWGWPVPLDDFAVRACRAALEIQRLLETPHDASFADFRIGLGIATGRAVAGKIGTEDQVKVTAFGPVVNLASRLESMTRQFQTSLLLDAQTAKLIQPHLNLISARIRPLLPVLPYGLTRPVDVFQLLPRPIIETEGPIDWECDTATGHEVPEPHDPHSSQHRSAKSHHSSDVDKLWRDYETALDVFNAGNWATAAKLLHPLADRDSAAHFLLNYIQENDQAAYPGYIKLTKK